MITVRSVGFFFGLFFFVNFCFFENTYGNTDNQEPGASSAEKRVQPELVGAVVCESLKELEPFNEAVVFSAALGKIVCFTAFDPVPEKTVVLHNWYHRDQMEKTFKLILKPPKWSSFSEIKIQNVDVGPWRVEILNAEGKILQILRFSVTE